jgi:hypothetical protein
MTKTITGSDTLVLFDRVITDFADGDVSTITFPNELVSMSTGKNQNTIYAKNEQGNNADLVIRLARGSADDKFLQSKIAEQLRDFVSFSLAEGQLVKKVGDGAGNVTNDSYNMEGGVFTKPVETKENVSGDIEQGVSIYNLRFALASSRSLG